MIDPDTQELRLDLARVDPALEVRDVAVGGTDLEDMLHGTDSFNLSFMSHMVYDPFAPPTDPLVPQLDPVEEMAQTLILSTDTYGNDIISAILGDDGIDPSDVTARRYGSIVTLDGLHFSDTGCGILANFFLDAIEGGVGTALPRVDLEELIAGDRRSPAGLVADGFDAAACEG